MAEYTTLLKTLIDIDYPLGLNDYPIFDEGYRTTLNDKIKNHYMYYEIGSETPALFVFRLNARLNEIMPYYNMQYENLDEYKKIKFFANKDISEDIDVVESFGKTIKNAKTGTETVQYGKKNIYDKIGTEDRAHTGNDTDTKTGNDTVTRTGTDTTTDSKQNIFSDTPENALNFDNIKGGRYATNVTFDSGTSTVERNTQDKTAYNNSIDKNYNSHEKTTYDITNTDTTSGTDTHTTNMSDTDTYSGSDNEHRVKHTAGIDISKLPFELFSQLMSAAVNIDYKIIQDLRDMFMMIY